MDDAAGEFALSHSAADAVLLLGPVVARLEILGRRRPASEVRLAEARGGSVPEQSATGQAAEVVAELATLSQIGAVRDCVPEIPPEGDSETQVNVGEVRQE